MSVLWTKETAVAATGGEATAEFRASGVSIDTRTLQPGDLFIALAAARDGHEFVRDALDMGASAAMVSRRPENVAADAPLLIVPDVLSGLNSLARFARARLRGKLVAVTGSVGKTGTKEMLRRALECQGTVHAAEKSFNNHWGVPLTLARMPADADFAVLEIGMNAPGEIAPLSEMARPHVALITAVDAVHIGAFGNIAAIAREKASIVRGLEESGTIVLNRDSTTYPVQLRAAHRAKVRLLRFGRLGRPEFRLLEARVNGTGTAVSVRYAGSDFLFRIAARGEHLAKNALGALAAVEALGGDMGLAAVALSNWEAPDGRGARWDVRLGSGGGDGTIRLIDESYNANPAAMKAALAVFGSEPPVSGDPHAKSRRVVFLGDMLELGSGEERMHAELAKAAEMSPVTSVYCAGPRMRHLYDALDPDRRGGWFKSAEAMAADAARLLEPGDIAMVKGSNGSRVWKVVDAIKAMGEATPVSATDR